MDIQTKYTSRPITKYILGLIRDIFHPHRRQLVIKFSPDGPVRFIAGSSPHNRIWKKRYDEYYDDEILKAYLLVNGKSHDKNRNNDNERSNIETLK